MKNSNIKFCGVWEVGYIAPLNEVDMWRFPLMDYGIEQLIMTPVSGIKGFDILKEVDDLEVELNNHRADGWTVVFLDENGESALEEFNYPDKVIYVFGRAGYSPYIAHKKENDYSISVKTPNQLGTLWPHQVTVLLLHDMWKKGKLDGSNTN